MTDLLAAITITGRMYSCSKCTQLRFTNHPVEDIKILAISTKILGTSAHTFKKLKSTPRKRRPQRNLKKCRFFDHRRSNVRIPKMIYSDSAALADCRRKEKKNEQEPETNSHNTHVFTYTNTTRTRETPII